MNDAGAASLTLPDLIADGLDLVFVGINPSIFSVQRGRYFARPSNRFWPCFSRSVLSRPARLGLGVDRLEPQHDAALLAYGIGFTDLVKRATAGAADLAPRELAGGVAHLRATLERYRPRVACFHGRTGYRYVERALAANETAAFALGPQRPALGPTRLYVIPNPSGANAHFTRAEQTRWYDRLAAYIAAASPAGA